MKRIHTSRLEKKGLEETVGVIYRASKRAISPCQRGFGNTL